jgi:hypothetical protein
VVGVGDPRRGQQAAGGHQPAGARVGLGLGLGQHHVADLVLGIEARRAQQRDQQRGLIGVVAGALAQGADRPLLRAEVQLGGDGVVHEVVEADGIAAQGLGSRDDGGMIGGGVQRRGPVGRPGLVDRKGGEGHRHVRIRRRAGAGHGPEPQQRRLAQRRLANQVQRGQAPLGQDLAQGPAGQLARDGGHQLLHRRRQLGRLALATGAEVGVEAGQRVHRLLPLDLRHLRLQLVRLVVRGGRGNRCRHQTPLGGRRLPGRLLGEGRRVQQLGGRDAQVTGQPLQPHLALGGGRPERRGHRRGQQAAERQQQRQRSNPHPGRVTTPPHGCTPI